MITDDRTAILDVISRYAYAWDGQDAAAWAGLFLPDAIWESFGHGSEQPARRFTGQTEIKAFAEQSFSGRLVGVRTRHFQTNTLFHELSESSARSTTMTIISHHYPHEQRAGITLTGVYDDVWQKTDAGWKLAHRILRSDRQ